MIINIHGFPPRYSQEDIKALISRIVRLNQFLVDQPEPDGRWLKVKVGCATEGDGQRLSYVLDNLEIDGFTLHVSTPAKAKTRPLPASACTTQSFSSGYMSQSATESNQSRGTIIKPDDRYRDSNTAFIQGQKPHYTSDPMYQERQNSGGPESSQYIRAQNEYPEKNTEKAVKFSNKSQQNEPTHETLTNPYRPTETNTANQSRVPNLTGKFKDPHRIVEFVGDPKTLRRDKNYLHEKFENFNKDSSQDLLIEKNELISRKRQYPNDHNAAKCHWSNTHKNTEETNTISCPSSMKDSNYSYIPTQQRVDNSNGNQEYRSTSGETDSISSNKLFYRRSEIIHKEPNIPFNEKNPVAEKTKAFIPTEATFMRPEVTRNDEIPANERNQRAYTGCNDNFSNQELTLHNQSDPLKCIPSGMYSPVNMEGEITDTCLNDDYDAERSERFEQLHNENAATFSFDQSNHLNDQMVHLEGPMHKKPSPDTHNAVVNARVEQINNRAISFQVETNNVMLPITGITPNPQTQSLGAGDINSMNQNLDKQNMNQEITPDESSKKKKKLHRLIEEIITPDTIDIPICDILLANPDIALSYKKKKTPDAISKNLLSRMIANRLLDLTKINDKDFECDLVADVQCRVNQVFPQMKTAGFTMRQMLRKYDEFTNLKFKPEHIHHLAQLHIDRNIGNPKFDVNNFKSDLTLATRPEASAAPATAPAPAPVPTAACPQGKWTSLICKAAERIFRDIFRGYQHLPKKFRLAARTLLSGRFLWVLGPAMDSRTPPELCRQFLARQPPSWLQEYIDECKKSYRAKVTKGQYEGFEKTLKRYMNIRLGSEEMWHPDYRYAKNIVSLTGNTQEAKTTCYPGSGHAGNIQAAKTTCYPGSGHAGNTQEAKLTHPSTSALAASFKAFVEAKKLQDYAVAPNVTSGSEGAKDITVNVRKAGSAWIAVSLPGPRHRPDPLRQIQLQNWEPFLRLDEWKVVGKDVNPNGIRLVIEVPESTIEDWGVGPMYLYYQLTRLTAKLLSRSEYIDKWMTKDSESEPSSKIETKMPDQMAVQKPEVNVPRKDGAKPVATVAPQNSMISTNVSNEGPLTNTMQQGPPSNMIQQGTPSNMMQQRPPFNTMQQGVHSNMMQGPPSNMLHPGHPSNMIQQDPPTNWPQNFWRSSQQGPPSNMMQQRFPTNMMQSGSLSNIMSQAPPSNIRRQGPPSNIMQLDYPSNMMQPGHSSHMMHPGRPSNMMQPGPPSNMMQPGPPSNMMPPGPPSNMIQQDPLPNTKKSKRTVAKLDRQKITKAIEQEMDSLSNVVTEACQQWNMFTELEEKVKEVALDAGATLVLLLRHKVNQRTLGGSDYWVLISAEERLPAKQDVERYLRQRWIGSKGRLKLRLAKRQYPLSYVAKVYSADLLDAMLAAREVWLPVTGQPDTLLRFLPRLERVSYRMRILERHERAARLTGALAGKAPAEALGVEPQQPLGTAEPPSEDTDSSDDDEWTEEW